MKLKTRFIFCSLILLFTVTLLIIPLGSAVDFPSDSFCVDDVDNTDFIWEVTILNDTMYSEPESFVEVSDQLRWEIDQFSTICVSGSCRDQIYGDISYKPNSTGIWTSISGDNIYLAQYAHYGNDPYSYVLSRGPMVAPRNATAIFTAINETYHFDNNNITRWTASGLLIIVSIFNGTPFLYGEEYQELAFNKDGILHYWQKSIGNGTAWVPVFRLEYQTKPGIPGFPILPTFLALNILLATYVLTRKKQPLKHTN